jgi:hypothetical protein
MTKPLKKVSPSKRKEKGAATVTALGKQPIVVRHKIPARPNNLTNHSMKSLQGAGTHSGPPTIYSSHKRHIGSGMLPFDKRHNEWHDETRAEEQTRAQTGILTEQRRALDMLKTLANEVTGLNRDRENLKKATVNADRAIKKTVDYLSPVREGLEGHRIRTDNVKQVKAPEDVFLRVLSPSKQQEDGDEAADQPESQTNKQDSQMKTPTRRITYDDEAIQHNLENTDRVLEMSPPLTHYNPTVIQHTFELNLDGITLEQLANMRSDNEQRIRNIETQYLQTDQMLQGDVAEATENFKDEQYIIQVNNEILEIPINSFAEINADMLGLDTNESEPEDHGHTISKRLMYELRFERYLKKKIRDEIERRDRFQQDKYVAPEVIDKIEKRKLIEKMVRERIEGPILSPEEQEIRKLSEQQIIDTDDEYMGILKQIFDEQLNGHENVDPNLSDEDSFEPRSIGAVDKNAFVETCKNAENTQPFLNEIAREPKGVSDIARENFTQVLCRMQRNFTRHWMTWDNILPYFTRKGAKVSEMDIKRAFAAPDDKEEYDENEVAARNRAINIEVKKLMAEMPMFPRKDGLGKYRITIPDIPTFMKRGRKKEKSIREKKLEEMIKYNDLEDEYEMSQQFRAKPIPKSTLEPRFQRIMDTNERRRQDVKMRSIALTKANERPFTFYEREMKKLNQPPVYDPEFDVMNYKPFKANPVPGHAKLEMFEYMMKKDQKEREERIKRNAELALTQSRLPPRMAMYEAANKINGEQKRSKSLDNPEFTFKPRKAKPVPDFERIQNNFLKQLDSKKQSKSLTRMTPFHFSETKTNKELRQYMDAANRPEEKLMTFKVKQARQEIAALKQPNHLAPSTMKYDALIEKRRIELEQKLLNEHLNAREELERKFKQTRMKQRIKKSPAIVDNTEALKESRERAMRQAMEIMLLREKQYERRKAEMEINVANRPLLVEMASKNFYNELLQMQEVEQYAHLLREAHLNLDDHLTPEQKTLLQKAEQLEQLNAEHAYFPTVDQTVLQQPMAEEMEMEGEGYDQPEYEEGEMLEGEEEEYEEEGDGYVEPINEVPHMEEMDHPDNMEDHMQHHQMQDGNEHEYDQDQFEDDDEMEEPDM